MLGVLQENQAAAAITKFFIDTVFDNAFIVSGDGHLLTEVGHFEWRRFLTTGVDEAINIKSILPALAAFQSRLASPTPNKSRFARLKATIDPESGLLRGTHVSKSVDVTDVKALAVVMAGGLGRRLGDLTINTPKPMLDLAGAPIAAHLIDNLIDNGLRRIFLSVFHLKDVVKNYFRDGGDRGGSIGYLEETSPLGTAGCLSLLPDEVDCPVLVVNGDVVTNVQFGRLVEFHRLSRNDITVSVRPYPLQIQFGIVDHAEGVVARIREKPKIFMDINVAIYVLSPSVLRHVPHGRSMDMPTLIEQLIPLGFKVGTFPLMEEWIDVGTVPDLQRARASYDPKSRTALCRPADTNVVSMNRAKSA